MEITKVKAKLLALDPSKSRTGWCVVEGHPVHPPDGMWMGSFPCESVREFARAVYDLLIEHGPVLVAYEEAIQYVKAYKRTDLGGSWTGGSASQRWLYKIEGAIEGVCGVYGYETLAVPAKTWRAKVLGNGNLDRAAAKAAAKTYCHRLGLDPRNHDQAEACCIALYAATTMEFRFLRSERERLIVG